MEEGLLYEHGKIRITKNVFINGQGAQFVIAGIKGIRDEHTGRSPYTLIAGAVLLGLSGIAAPFAYSRPAMVALGAVLIAWYLTRKESWRIYLTGPQGEVEAFRTQDAQEFRNVSICLKKAIAAHQG